MESVAFDTLSKIVFIKLVSCEVQEIGHVIPTAEPLPNVLRLGSTVHSFISTCQNGSDGIPGSAHQLWLRGVSLGHSTVMSAPMWFQDAARFVALHSANGKYGEILLSDPNERTY